MEMRLRRNESLLAASHSVSLVCDPRQRSISIYEYKYIGKYLAFHTFSVFLLVWVVSSLCFISIVLCAHSPLPFFGAPAIVLSTFSLVDLAVAISNSIFAVRNSYFVSTARAEPDKRAKYAILVWPNPIIKFRFVQLSRPRECGSCFWPMWHRRVGDGWRYVGQTARRHSLQHGVEIILIHAPNIRYYRHSLVLAPRFFFVLFDFFLTNITYFPERCQSVFYGRRKSK